jgi:hypothetical protein
MTEEKTFQFTKPIWTNFFYVLLTVHLDMSVVRWTTDSHLKRISTNCCIHTVVPPDDGPRYARNM